jgi:hypothetical protein
LPKVKSNKLNIWQLQRDENDLLTAFILLQWPAENFEDSEDSFKQLKHAQMRSTYLKVMFPVSPSADDRRGMANQVN